MFLLDVNALVALVWDSHVHHVPVRAWFAKNAAAGWATCSVTESGFVRVSSNPAVLPSPIGVEQARDVLRSLRLAAHHQFLTDDVSMVDPDVPTMVGHRQVTDGQLLTLARRHDGRLLTFDRGIASLAQDVGVELLFAMPD